VTFVGGAIAFLRNPSAIRTGLVSVYQSIDSLTGRIIYVGITNNFERRAAQHFASKGIAIEKVEGLSNLSRMDSRSVEQVLIEFYGLGKNGGTLLNKINSIASRNPEYAAAIARGRELLKFVGYPGI
jgi:hypothetical protein